MNIIRKEYKKLRWDLRDKFISEKQRKLLTNKEFTIISSDCTAGMLYHDMKLRCDTPTRNFFFMAPDYIKFCKNIKYYIDISMAEVPQTKYPYPVAKLDDIFLYLVHYDSVHEAQEKWNERKTRIHWDNLYFVMNDRNGCKEEDLIEFDKLEGCVKKVVFTHIRHPEIKNSFYIKGFEKKDSVGIMAKFTSPISIKRNMDQFDFVSWLNN